MRNAMVRLLVVSLMTGVGATASAQQTVTVNILEEYETLNIQRGSVGCFDVLAAVRLQAELRDGAFTEPTRQAFSYGACVVSSQGLSLANAQQVEIENAIFVRGEMPDVGATLYIPAELVDVSISETAAAPLVVIADQLRLRVGELQLCSRERDALDAKIDAFNARVEAVLAREPDEELATGSRLKGTKTLTITAVELADEEKEALRQESFALQDEASAHKERCGAYEAGIALDEDYMAYYRLTTAAAN